MPEARGVVGHGVNGTGNVIGGAAVTEVALVEAGQAEQVCSGSSRGPGTFPKPRGGSCIVAKVGGSTVSEVKVLGQDIGMGNAASQL